MARPTDAEAAGQSEDDVHEGRAEVPTGSLRLLSWRTSPRMMMMKPSGKFWVKDSQTRCSMITWQNAFGRSSTWPRRMVREWTSKVTETFAKCRRKVKVQFPLEAQGWICLHQSGLSEDQRAIVTAKTQGDLKL